MDNWRDDVRQRLMALHDSLSAPKVDSQIPGYVLESLAANVSNRMLTTLDADSIRWLVRGTFRAIADVCTFDDDDPIIRQLSQIGDALPAEDN